MAYYNKILFSLISFFWFSCAPADQRVAGHFVSFESPEMIKVKAGERSTISLKFQIQEGYHIMAFSEEEDHFIPSQLSFEQDDPLEIRTFKFPEPYDYFIEDIDAPLSVLEGEIEIEVEILASNKGKQLIEGSLRYQACDHRKCFFPKELSFNFEVKFY